MEEQKEMLEIPPFWRNAANLWFMRIEAQFRIASITQDKIKFDIIIGSLECDILIQIHDIIKNPPLENKYEILKKRIISIFGGSHLQSHKLQGDFKPSELLNEFRKITNNNLGDDFLKNIWLQQLPTTMQSVLSVNDVALNVLARIADRMWTLQLFQSVNVIQDKSQKNSDIAKLCEKIMELTTKIDLLSIHNYKLRSRSISPKRNKEICYYHLKFGTEARKCKYPCIMQ